MGVGVLLCNAYTVEVLLTQTLRSRSLRPGTRRERNTELEYPFETFIFRFLFLRIFGSRLEGTDKNRSSGVWRGRGGRGRGGGGAGSPK